MQAYIRFTGMDFGSYTDNSSAKYSVSLFKVRDNNKKKNYCFKFLQKLVTRIDFQFPFNEQGYETLVLQIHKHGFFGKELVAETNIPLGAYPLNTRCSDRLPLNSAKQLQIPINVYMDVHVSDGKYNPFYAPHGKSMMLQFNPEQYKCYENNNNNIFLSSREATNTRLI